jgi:hypothetical protein
VANDLGLLAPLRFDREADADRLPAAFGILEDQRDMGAGLVSEEIVLIELSKTITAKGPVRTASSLLRIG